MMIIYKKAFFKKQRRAESPALLFFVLMGGFFLSSCIVVEDGSRPSAAGSVEEDRKTPKESDPEKQLRCKERGSTPCEGDSGCEEICSDIFSRAADERKCIDLPLELVQEFQSLFELVDKGDDIRDINLDVLECILDIDEKHFVREMEGLNRKNTEAFLIEVAASERLGGILESEDDEHLLLENLYENLSSRGDDLRRLTVSIDGGSHLFELIMEEKNQSSWDWLAEYVDKECEGSDLCYSEKKDDHVPLVFYCRLFLDLEEGRLTSVLRSDLFEDYFSHDIEREQVCGSTGDQDCDSRYRDHFESVCSSYTDQRGLGT